MCNCKKSQCQTNACSCRKANKQCHVTCTCVNCKNRRQKPPESVKVNNSHPYAVPLVVYSWNMCNFCAIYEDFSNKEKKDSGEVRKWTPEEQQQLLQDTKRAFQYLARHVDILVLQEFRFDAKQAKLVVSWMSEEDFSYAISEVKLNLEYMFIWRKERIRPMKERVDDKIHLLMKDGLKRPLGSMRFMDIEHQVPIVCTTFHLKSGGGKETQDELNVMMAGYDEAFLARYGREQKAIHILVGDVNLNPHLTKFIGDFYKPWSVLGNGKTVTSVGGYGYDFFMIRSVGYKCTSTDQMCLPLRRAKNSALSKIGISDHYPIYIHLSLQEDPPSINEGSS